MWFLTIDPFVRIPFSSQSFPSDNTAGVLSRTFRVKNISYSLTYTIASSCLHFSIGGNDNRKTTRFRQSIHFGFTQVLFADHVHWHSGVDNKFSFLRFQRWCRQAPIFRRWEECCSLMLLLISTHFWPASTLLRGHLTLATVSSCERSSNFGALGQRSWGSPGQM